MKSRDVIIIGGGQAGLSASYYLKREGIDHVVLDERGRIGDQWRERWESLRLFTPSKFNDLPGMDFPGEPWSLAKKDEVADFLERYVYTYDLPVRMQRRAERLVPKDGFTIETNRDDWQADYVIVATGAFQDPSIPSCRSKLDEHIPQWHSSEYNEPSEVPEGRVLVVGTGNSGIQIAEDLSSTHEVHLSGRENTNFPRRFLGKDIYWWFDLFGLLKAGRDTWLGKRLYRKAKSGGDPIIGASLEKRCANCGIERHPKVADAGGSAVIFEDGSRLEHPSGIIWATGFAPDFDWIEADIFNEDGYPRHERGIVGERPGLYFIGLRWLYTGDSSLIGGVGRDARYVVNHLCKQMALDNTHNL